MFRFETFEMSNFCPFASIGYFSKEFDYLFRINKIITIIVAIIGMAMPKMI